MRTERCCRRSPVRPCRRRRIPAAPRRVATGKMSVGREPKPTPQLSSRPGTQIYILLRQRGRTSRKRPRRRTCVRRAAGRSFLHRSGRPVRTGCGSPPRRERADRSSRLRWAPRADVHASFCLSHLLIAKLPEAYHVARKYIGQIPVTCRHSCVNLPTRRST